MKRALLEAPALGLPDVTRCFILYVHEKKGTDTGVFVQPLGSWEHFVIYLFKQLDSVAKGWLTCLRAIKAIAILAQEVDKLTFGQDVKIRVPHEVQSLLEHKGNYWFTNSWMVQYQALMCENPRVKITTSGLPASRV